ncbi:hypothetical protein BC940DRAFT_363287 [Gongronella butleri]|nr:hypothetical protein BC940DRAFT_363287 [Gongronella butleri]
MKIGPKVIKDSQIPVRHRAKGASDAAAQDNRRTTQAHGKPYDRASGKDNNSKPVIKSSQQLQSSGSKTQTTMLTAEKRDEYRQAKGTLLLYSCGKKTWTREHKCREHEIAKLRALEKKTRGMRDELGLPVDQDSNAQDDGQEDTVMMSRPSSRRVANMRKKRIKDDPERCGEKIWKNEFDGDVGNGAASNANSGT